MYKAIFFNKIADVFFFRTKPASNMEKPNAMNITKTPLKTNKNVLNTDLPLNFKISTTISFFVVGKLSKL